MSEQYDNEMIQVYRDAKRTRELEAEVKRLREEAFEARNMRDKWFGRLKAASAELEAYRTAVMKLKDIVQYGRIDSHGLHHLLTVLDNLPKHE